MSEEKINYLPYEEAVKIVAAIQEEEDIERKNRRILTVYSHDDKELCWYDYDDIMESVEAEGKTKAKSDVQDYILRHIPDWVLDI